MKNFKFTPKVALIIVLVLITIAGIYLYTRNGGSGNKVNEADNKGFLSFFGDRKIKPVDETTVPGVNANNGSITAGNTAGTTAGTDTGGGNTAGGNTANGVNSGNITLRPIGVNTINNGGGPSAGNTLGGSNGTNGRFTAGNTGGNTGGNTAGNTGGGTGTNVNPPAEQVNCTPKEIEFTDEEKAKLKALSERFYKVAAELKSEQDVETLVRTRENYYSYLSSDYSAGSRKDGTGVVELTKQCFTERAKVAEDTAGFQKLAKPFEDFTGPRTENEINSFYSALYKKFPFANKPIGMRPNPFITKDMFIKLASLPPLRPFLNKDKLLLTSEQKDLTTKVKTSEDKIASLESQANSKQDQIAKALFNDDFTAANSLQLEYDKIALDLNTEKTNLPYMKEKLERVKVLLDQATNDPMSYFANSTSYVKEEPPSEKETELSRRNAVYQNVQSMFWNAFEWGDVLDKVWGGGDWSKANNNPLRDAGFSKVCSEEIKNDPNKRSGTVDGVFKCFERYYPMQDLERILGIW